MRIHEFGWWWCGNLNEYSYLALVSHRSPHTTSAMFRTANATHAASVATASPSHHTPSVDRHATGSSRASVKRYPHRLNFYNRPPTVEVTIDEFEGWAIDRLRGASSHEKGIAPFV